MLPAAPFAQTVIPAFTEGLNTTAFEVTDEIGPFYEMEARGSQITVLFP